VRRFWKPVVHPLLELVQPKIILEIGAAGGKHTRLLADYCGQTGATLHVIEPEPRFDTEALLRDGVVLHRDLSLNVLPSLPAVDVALVDGDHNWYTVVNELRELQRAAREARRPMPVVLCHDIAWPYGRRDLYYFPETIPDEFRQPWERKGMTEGRSELVPEGGQNPQSANACVEGGPRNGVLAAIEDFLGEAGEEISIRMTPDNYGLAVLVPKTRSPDGELEAAVERLLAAGPRSMAAARVQATATQEIPKVIHHVWLGPDPVSEPLELYAASWRAHHPEWEVRLWRDDTLPPLALGDVIDALDDERWTKGRTLTPANRALITWRARYDIVRLEVLRQFGGVIVDMDVEAIRPLDPLLGGVAAFAGRTRDAQLKIGNQVLGATPEHPFLEYATKRIRELAAVAESANQLAGHSFLTSAVNERPQGVTIFPRDTFYSLLTIEPPKRPADFPQIYAVHHHLQSYLGPQAEAARLLRQLSEAQGELERVYRRQHRAKAENTRLRSRLESAEQRVEQLTQKLDRARDDHA
jgi:hypothetical protein